MQYLEKESRTQLTLYTTCLDDMIGQENSVRAIDQFVDLLDLEKLGFAPLPSQGRPPYNPADLLKLYIYGYMNRMRSSRQLERECHRNIELMWLLGNLKPDHNTIARFRKDNPKAIKRVFRATVQIAKNHDLIGAQLIAGDSTKLRAHNSKKNNYNHKKVQRHLDYIDRKLQEHETALAEADNDTDRENHQQQIDKHKKHRNKYCRIQQNLGEDTTTGNPQISTSDPDSRHQITRGMITEVCYTAQISSDAKHNLIFDYLVTNENDKKAMGGMLRRAKTILRTNDLTALYDKGYHTGSEFKTAHDLGIETLVAIPAIGRKSQAPDPAYNLEHFGYDKDNDHYTCPQGHTLTSNGSWYRARNYRFKQYKTAACRDCPVRHSCTTAKHNGKIIQRSEFTQYIHDNAKRVAKNQEIYKRRQAIVEHPFGTIKRQWGFDHIMTKRGLKAASADFGLIAIAYNLKRMMNIIKASKGGIKRSLTLIKAISALCKALITHLKSKKQNNVQSQLFNRIFKKQTTEPSFELSLNYK